MRKYVDPKVELIDGTRADLGFYTWLKSRRQVITLKNNTRIDDVILDRYDNITFLFGDKESIIITTKQNYDQMSSPEEYYIYEFYVDDELVEVENYRNRIIKSMNLQYNNFPQYTFEITGSALFRDFLFNINWNPAWAESNRFLFSILPDDAVLEEENYKISSEYKNIPEWEDQFKKYMDKIHETQITDENRTEMPYSISSFFWWGCNHKTLINVLSAMKIDFPFFYEIYGKKLLNEVGLSESDLKPYIDYSLLQYYRCDNWSEGITKNSDFYIMNIKLSYIILSQFLRQSPSIISGLYSDLKHNNPEEFSHKVFRGDTLCNITFVAHKSKVMSTISKRSCNFAANSGNGPGSWSGFIEKFLDSVETLDDFRELLPCSFDNNGLLKFCPLWDDVKFRNSGTESRNCVCPLTTCSISDAEKKCNRDKNKLSELFMKLTEDIINKGGVKYIHKV